MSFPTGSENVQLKLSLEPGRRIFRVAELNSELQHLFEAEFRGIWVSGEISGCRTAGSGHYYFSLKDETSQIKCALFKGTARYVRFKPQDGLAVIARGNLEVYEARGEYQLIVESLEPQGAGALQIAFEQLKKKLSAEGLFEAGRKRPLPKLAGRIGVVTSPSGAAIRDILHVLERRFRGLHVRLFPAQVQGEGAAEQICAALRFFSDSKWPDVVILARGGGSLEDLWTFNEEAVARAIAGSSAPVISAIGHETDFTIADFVADYRAPTPSAAAEIVVRTSESLLEQIAGCRSKVIQAVRYRMALAARDLQQRGTERAARLIGRLLTSRGQRCDELDDRIRSLLLRSLEARRKRWRELTRGLEANDLKIRLSRNRHRGELLEQRAMKAMEAKLWQSRKRQESMQLHLNQLSPLTILGRGYAIVEDAHGKIVRSVEETRVEDALRVRLHRGELGVRVTEK